MAQEDPNAEDAVDPAMKRGGFGKTKKKETEQAPIYKKMEDSKIPVSKKYGPLWRSRRDAALAAQKKASELWDEAVAYFSNDQTNHRRGKANSDTDTPGNDLVARQHNEILSETENLVFANTTTLMDIVYSKNPDVEITAYNQANDDLAAVDERLIGTLFSKKTAPGVNAKPKFRRALLSALLTNQGVIKLDWTLKQYSAENAMEELIKLSKQLEEAKDLKEILAIEGKIMALEDSVDALTPSGPKLKVINNKHLLIDPTCEEMDLSDCNWVLECDMLPTSFLNAVFGQEADSESGRVKSIYKPTHVMKTSANPDHELQDSNSFFDYDETSKGSSLGFADEHAYQRAQYTKVWYIWDKVTRRVFMYHDGDWTWPIWVWDDPLHLPRFFPYFLCYIHESPPNTIRKGEVVYYLDQQDAVNEINDVTRRARLGLRRNVLFNKNQVEAEAVEAVLRGPDGTAKGVDVPEGQKLEDVIFTFSPLSDAVNKNQLLFDKTGKYQAIDRISSVSEFLRGGQFKTNTTNDAVESYKNASQVRIDGKVDAIEDFVGDIALNLLYLCHQFMSPEEVYTLTGYETAKAWRQMPPQEFEANFSMNVVGSSTQKPTSIAKKREAVEAGQVLGQFASASPAVIMIVLKMFEQAFDDIVLTDQDWKMITQSVQQSMMQGQEQAQQTADGGSEESKAQLKQMIDQLPPEKKQQLKQLIDQGASPTEALKQVSGSA